MTLSCPPAQWEEELSVKVHLKRGAGVSQHGGGNCDHIEEVMVARGEEKGEIRSHKRSISQPSFDLTLHKLSCLNIYIKQL